jgi:hypothetical protein
MEISERSFEDAIERALLSNAPGASSPGPAGVREEPPPYGEHVPGGYLKRLPDEYDRSLCLIPCDVLDFILATQPKEWKRLKEHHGTEVRERFLKRLEREIERRGSLDGLRNGVKDSGCKFTPAYFRPASGLNEELQRLHAANLFALVRQLHYSENDKDTSIDMALFLNGIPIFTAELKNPLTGPNVEEGVKQYQTTRDPREPLFAYGRCLAHFAVDHDLVYVTTHLQGVKTRFLPFNQGKFGGAGNPPVPRPPTRISSTRSRPASPRVRSTPRPTWRRSPGRTSTPRPRRTGCTSRTHAAEGLSEMFGLEMAATEEVPVPGTARTPAKRALARRAVEAAAVPDETATAATRGDQRASSPAKRTTSKARSRTKAKKRSAAK